MCLRLDLVLSEGELLQEVTKGDPVAVGTRAMTKNEKTKKSKE